MTATLHRVVAGNGYEYYLRNVATQDETGRGRSSLGDYYSVHGEAPGTWLGSGLTALGLAVGEEVTEAQMKSLYGLGRHPDAEAIESLIFEMESALGAEPADAARAADRATRLGSPFRFSAEVPEFQRRCAREFARFNLERGLDPLTAVPEEDRARIRTRAATAMFTTEYDRPPVGPRELSGWVTKNSRPKSAAVAAFDITFSPVKSVSALWAIAPLNVSQRIEAAHDKAVTDAIRWLEQHALYTRLGRNGIRRVDVEGVVAACFRHRESRAGDPDLHTHVLISNRVRTLAGGLWRTLDSATLHKFVVTVSEIYNTRLEHHLTHDVGVGFAERAGTDPAKRPIREIVGVPLTLITAWSQRDAAITARLGQLAADFQAELGREPLTTELYALAELATLQTRPAKKAVRSFAEQRGEWRAAATTVLGGRDQLAATVTAALNPLPRPPIPRSAQWAERIADQVVAVVGQHRAVWQHQHVRAEVERQIRDHVDRDEWASAVEAVLAEALAPARVVRRGDPDAALEPVLAQTPEMFRRADGTSVYAGVDADSVYTSARMLTLEHQLIELFVQPGGRALDPRLVADAVTRHDQTHPDTPLNPGQVALLTEFTRADGPRIRTTNAPAGAGKTTAMTVLADAWRAGGGTVLGLAPLASAASVLAAEIGGRVETVDKLLHILDGHAPAHLALAENDTARPIPQWVLDIGPDTLVIVDEWIKMGTLTRWKLLRWLTSRDASIRLIGDDRQLPAIDASGVEADIADTDPVLSEVVRFNTAGEAAAGLRLREGDPIGLGWYLDHDRVHAGHPGATHDNAYTAWATDVLAGRASIMLAATHTIVTDLNARARADRLHRDGPPTTECALADGLHASIGDLIRTTRNNRALRTSDGDWVRNGDTWTVTHTAPDGSLTAQRRRPGRSSGPTVALPADYVRSRVRLGYAATIDSSQGATVDTCHIALDGGESRQQLYMALTRGRGANHVYVPTTLDGTEADFLSDRAIMPRTATEVLLHILDRDGAQQSAHTHLREALAPRARLGAAVDTYLDAVGVAAENTVGATLLARIDHAADTVYPHLADAPAWPVLRQHLAVLALSGHDPITALTAAAAERELDSARDPAAVLDWRLDPTGAHSARGGPLPWTPAIPDGITDPTVRGHLHARARIITTLTDQLRTEALTWTATTAPAWARPLLGPDPGLVADLAVWRAAQHVGPHDLRPTGPPRQPALERTHQHHLDTRVAVLDTDNATARWSEIARRIDPRLPTDPYWPIIATDIETAHRAGIDITHHLTTAAAQRPLPDDLPASALWSRLDHTHTTPTPNPRRHAPWNTELAHTPPAETTAMPHPTDPAATEPAETESDPLPDELARIAELFRAGDTRAAKAAFRHLTHTLTAEQRDILDRVAATLNEHSYVVAVARLRWAADHLHPEYATLIRACIPTTNPQLHQHLPHLHDTRTPPTPPVPATDIDTRLDTTPPRPRRTIAETDAQRAHQDYLDRRADLDTDPDHNPLPEGAPHPYYQKPRAKSGIQLPEEQRYPDTAPARDTDAWTLTPTLDLPCVCCGLERLNIDLEPPPHRQSNDGLCSECRDNNQPGIPDHHPRNRITARCDYYATHHPPHQLAARLRRDLHATRTTLQQHYLATRMAIHTWIDNHPHLLTPHALLTNTELTQRIHDIEQQLHTATPPSPDPDHDADSTARAAIERATTAARRHQQASQALQRNHAETQHLRDTLDATPTRRRTERHTLQQRIDALLGDQQRLLRRHNATHAHAESTHRDAINLAGHPSTWPQTLSRINENPTPTSPATHTIVSPQSHTELQALRAELDHRAQTSPTVGHLDDTEIPDTETPVLGPGYDAGL
ncbi:MobF family relaxase [Nocardia puris]|uniref:MobF family relaxase n=1 Tax=Nocardia puris TaxID=208602 RepID=UPI002E1B4D1E